MWKYILMTVFISPHDGWTQDEGMNEEMEEYSNSDFVEEGRDLEENLEKIEENEFEDFLENDIPIISPEEDNPPEDKEELNPYE